MAAMGLHQAGTGSDTTTSHLLRIAGHLRLYIALLAVIVRVAAVLAVVWAWTAAVSMRWDIWHRPSMQAWGVLAAATLVVVQLAIPNGRRPLVRGLLVSIGAAGIGAIIGLAGLGLMEPVYSYHEKGKPVLTAVTLGFAVIAVLLIEYFRRRAVSRGGELDEVVSLLPQGESAEVQGTIRWLAGAAERAGARTIVTVQLITAVVPLSFLTLLGYSYMQYARRQPSVTISLKDGIIWLVIGALVGVGFAVTTLRTGLMAAVAASAMLVAAGIGLGALCLNASVAADAADIARWLLTSAVAAGGTVPAVVIVRSVCLVPIRRLLPLAVQRMVLADVPAGDEMSQLAPALHCEACGYALQGLPESTCAACAVMSLRCPECGHVQPASVRYARLLRRLHRQHLLVRVQDLALRGLIAAGALIGAFAFGFALQTVPQAIGRAEVFLGVTVVVTLIGVLRYIMLRVKPAWQASILCGVTPVLAGVLGMLASLRQNAVPPVGPTLGVAVAAVLVAMVFPWLWSRWLRVLFGRELAERVHGWETSAVYQREPVGAIVGRCGPSLFCEVPEVCGECGRVLAETAVQCSACGCHVVRCECGAPMAVSATRAGMGALLYRARMMALASLALLAAGFALIVLVQLGLHGQDAYRFNLGYGVRGYRMASVDRLYLPDRYAYGMVAAGVGGAVASLLLIRRRAVYVAAGACAFWFAAMQILTDQRGLPAFVMATGCEAAAAFVAALVARPMLARAAWALLPEGVGGPLVGWLTGRLTLDQATSRLPLASSGRP